jgi:hypothetical protein
MKRKNEAIECALKERQVQGFHDCAQDFWSGGFFSIKQIRPIPT